MKNGLKIYQNEIFNDDLKIEKENTTVWRITNFLTTDFHLCNFLKS